jgi:hypothetical protein
VLFVDGVRRVDANLWIEDVVPVLGVCATYAAGAVRCDGRASLEAAEVRRGLFTSAAGAETVATRHARYEVRVVAGEKPEDLWLGVQQRMGELEREVTNRVAAAELTVVDGPLSGRAPSAGTVGLVKTHHIMYLPEPLRPVLAGLAPGERTPLFVTSTTWSRYSWYLRLPGAETGSLTGTVRCEASADIAPDQAAALADRVSSTLPRFASSAHKDPRAPQNLYPIGGLERALRRRLGDPLLLYRALRVAAAG